MTQYFDSFIKYSFRNELDVNWNVSWRPVDDRDYRLE
jgi:hypothetical protein